MQCMYINRHSSQTVHLTQRLAYLSVWVYRLYALGERLPAVYRDSNKFYSMYWQVVDDLLRHVPSTTVGEDAFPLNAFDLKRISQLLKAVQETRRQDAQRHKPTSIAGALYYEATKNCERAQSGRMTLPRAARIMGVSKSAISNARTRLGFIPNSKAKLRDEGQDDEEEGLWVDELP